MVKKIRPEDVVKRLQNREEVTVIDVRESGEFAAGKIPGVKHIPLGQLALRKDELDKGKSYIVTCQSGNRSKAACGLLEALGYEVEDLMGGMNAWRGEIE